MRGMERGNKRKAKHKKTEGIEARYQPLCPWFGYVGLVDLVSANWRKGDTRTVKHKRVRAYTVSLETIVVARDALEAAEKLDKLMDSRSERQKYYYDVVEHDGLVVEVTEIFERQKPTFMVCLADQEIMIVDQDDGGIVPYKENDNDC